MCGRYTLIASPVQIKDFFGLEEVPEFAPRYNVAPSQEVPIVRLDEKGTRRLVQVRWGLIPSWAEDASIGYKLINARSETVADKPSFRAAFRQRRCLVPASGFFEWRANGKTKQPFYIHQRDGLPLAIAALWERWKAPEGQPVESCTLLTTEANQTLRPLHQRMPVFLAQADHTCWFEPSAKPADLLPLLRPYSAEELVAYAVSSQVNNPRNEGPRCILPLASPSAN
jgi:putative SOS response-associated peptidase YedK